MSCGARMEGELPRLFHGDTSGRAAARRGERSGVGGGRRQGTARLLYTLSPAGGRLSPAHARLASQIGVRAARARDATTRHRGATGDPESAAVTAPRDPDQAAVGPVVVIACGAGAARPRQNAGWVRRGSAPDPTAWRRNGSFSNGPWSAPAPRRANGARRFRSGSPGQSRHAARLSVRPSWPRGRRGAHSKPVLAAAILAQPRNLSRHRP